GWRFSPSIILKPSETGKVLLPVKPAHFTDANTVLEVKRVSKRFGGITALTDVSLDVRPGEIHGPIGPNGAGKTTLFNIIAGFYPVDSGNILLESKEVSNQSPQQLVRQGIARTFQNIRLFGGLSALENVMLGAHTRPGHGAFEFASLFSPDRER